MTKTVKKDRFTWLDNIDKDSPLSDYIYEGLDAVAAELETLPKDWHFVVEPMINFFTGTSFNSNKEQKFLHKFLRIVNFMCMYAEEKARHEKGGKA